MLRSLGVGGIENKKLKMKEIFKANRKFYNVYKS